MEEERIYCCINKIKSFYFEKFKCDRYDIYITANSDDCCLVSLYGTKMGESDILGNWFFKDNVYYVLSLFKRDETLADITFEK